MTNSKKTKASTKASTSARKGKAKPSKSQVDAVTSQLETQPETTSEESSTMSTKLETQTQPETHEEVQPEATSEESSTMSTNLETQTQPETHEEVQPETVKLGSPSERQESDDVSKSTEFKNYHSVENMLVLNEKGLDKEKTLEAFKVWAIAATSLSTPSVGVESAELIETAKDVVRKYSPSSKGAFMSLLANKIGLDPTQQDFSNQFSDMVKRVDSSRMFTFSRGRKSKGVLINNAPKESKPTKEVKSVKSVKDYSPKAQLVMVNGELDLENTLAKFENYLEESGLSAEYNFARFETPLKDIFESLNEVNNPSKQQLLFVASNKFATEEDPIGSYKHERELSLFKKFLESTNLVTHVVGKRGGVFLNL